MARSPTSDSRPNRRPQALEEDVIAFWVRIATLLGYSRSVGEIFGLIFLSEDPLSADDLVERLRISRSSAGQGLKALHEIGAIRSAHLLASRKEHFRMETDLGVLVKQLLNTRVFARLEELSQQKNALANAARHEGNKHLIQRFEKLQRWQEKASPVLKVLRALT